MYLGGWIKFFLQQYACPPLPEEMVLENLKILQKELQQAHHLQRFNFNGEKVWWPIFGLFPDFSGQPQDWCNFEKEFKSVATSLGLAYIFQEQEGVPITPLQSSNIAMI
jgi:hypothetical protein